METISINDQKHLRQIFTLIGIEIPAELENRKIKLIEKSTNRK